MQPTSSVAQIPQVSESALGTVIRQLKRVCDCRQLLEFLQRSSEPEKPVTNIVHFQNPLYLLLWHFCLPQMDSRLLQVHRRIDQKDLVLEEASGTVSTGSMLYNSYLLDMERSWSPILQFRNVHGFQNNAFLREISLHVWTSMRLILVIFPSDVSLQLSTLKENLGIKASPGNPYEMYHSSLIPHCSHQNQQKLALPLRTVIFQKFYNVKHFNTEISALFFHIMAWMFDGSAG